MVTLTEINEQNWLDAARLRVTPEQQRFVAPAVGILARAYALRASNARAFGICDGGVLSGLLLVRDLTEPPACYELQQLLVDASAQNRGIAQSALTQLLALLTRERRFDTVELCVHRDDAPALHLYRKLGFADTGYTDPDLPDCLCLSRPLTEPSVTELRPNVWAVGEGALRKRYPDAASAARAARLLDALAAQHAPTPRALILDGPDLLTTRLPGAHPDRLNDAPARTRTLGRAIAQLHRAMQAAHLDERLPQADLAAELRGWVGEQYAAHAPEQLPALESTARQLDLLAPQLPRGPIHRDLQGKNLLFDGETLTGFIDFDLAQVNFRVYDLCYLACCESLTDPALDALLAGYEEIQPLSAAERAAFPPLTQTCTAIYRAFLWKTGK